MCELVYIELVEALKRSKHPDYDWPCPKLNEQFIWPLLVIDKPMEPALFDRPIFPVCRFPNSIVRRIAKDLPQTIDKMHDLIHEEYIFTKDNFVEQLRYVHRLPMWELMRHPLISRMLEICREHFFDSYSRSGRRALDDIEKIEQAYAIVEEETLKFKNYFKK